MSTYSAKYAGHDKTSINIIFIGTRVFFARYSFDNKNKVKKISVNTLEKSSALFRIECKKIADAYQDRAIDAFIYHAENSPVLEI